MSPSKILIGLVLTSLTSAAWAGSSNQGQQLKQGYLHYDVVAKSRRPLTIRAEIHGYSPSGRDGFATGFKRSRTFSIPGVHPEGDVDTMRYDFEAFDNVPTDREGLGHGFITAVSARGKGIVIVDTNTQNIAHGTQPEARLLYSLKSIREAPVVGAIAARAGLDPRTLRLRVTDPVLSSAFTPKTFLTLRFSLHLADATGKRIETPLSTVIQSKFEAHYPLMVKDGELEEGVHFSFGRAYPPSWATQ